MSEYGERLEALHLEILCLKNKLALLDKDGAVGYVLLTDTSSYSVIAEAVKCRANFILGEIAGSLQYKMQCKLTTLKAEYKSLIVKTAYEQISQEIDKIRVGSHD